MIELNRAGGARRSASRKVSRGSIATMLVAASDCPRVLKEVLGLIAEHHRVPFSICARLNMSEQHFCVEIEELPDRSAEALLEKATTIVSVKHAAWMARVM